MTSWTRAKPALYYGALFLLFFSLLYLRRSAQLLHPQVWDEDGTQIIPGLIDHGLKSLLYPVNGYLVLVPKLVSAISLSISGLHYPMVSTVITWIFISWVCIAIATSPTWLKGGVLLGVATLLIPADPEVFGIPLYSFWWASLLLFLVVLWEENSMDVARRVIFTLLGGLSSPIVFLATLFLIVRAIVFRGNRRERVVLAAALFCCVAQAIAMFHSPIPLTSGTMTATLRYALPKFAGGYLASNFVRTTNHLVWIATAFLLAFVVLAIPLMRRNPCYVFLLGLWGGAVYFIGRRVDLSLLQPRYGAPRYFFLPFVVIAWFLVSVLTESRRWHLRVFAAGLLFVSLLNMIPVRTRPQQDFHWAQHVADCGHSDPYAIPISFDGERPWFLEVNRKECAALQRAGLINLTSHMR